MEGSLRRVNTVCVEILQGSLLDHNVDVLLLQILQDTYKISNDDIYGVSVNGASRVFVKFTTSTVYEDVVQRYQDLRCQLMLVALLALVAVALPSRIYGHNRFGPGSGFGDRRGSFGHVSHRIVHRHLQEPIYGRNEYFR
ncbi:uncharacterized protein [Cherax quadricarinatus]|uniref:uncharacterized protein n=1 Tax=Cherax quadricarinatus TaxID=27406 RepID=UPI00387E3EC2